MNAAPEDEARGRREGRRIAHFIVIVVAVWFIGASASQIIPAVFGIDSRPLTAIPSDSAETKCGVGVRALAFAVDRAGGMAWTRTDREGESLDLALERTRLAFRLGLAPEWDAQADVEELCAKSSAGLDAWAALLRLRRAHEQMVLHGLVELVPLERDVTAHLPVNLR
jgi:hypothetical protein